MGDKSFKEILREEMRNQASQQEVSKMELSSEPAAPFGESVFVQPVHLNFSPRSFRVRSYPRGPDRTQSEAKPLTEGSELRAAPSIGVGSSGSQISSEELTLEFQGLSHKFRASVLLLFGFGGLEPSQTLTRRLLKQAYRAAVKRHHPDLSKGGGGEDPAEILKRIQSLKDECLLLWDTESSEFDPTSEAA